MNNEQLIMTYFIHNQKLLKELLQPIKDDAGVLLYDDNLNELFLDRALWIIVSHLCLQLKVSVDMVLQFMDNVNVRELLK